MQTLKPSSKNLKQYQLKPDDASSNRLIVQPPPAKASFKVHILQLLDRIKAII